MIAVSLDGKLIFSVGHWDYSLQVFSLVKGKTVASVVHHFGKFGSKGLEENDLVFRFSDLCGFGRLRLSLGDRLPRYHLCDMGC